MSKLQTVLTALNEKNFDTLSNQSLNMVKGGTYCPPPPPACGAVKSRKSSKIKIKRSNKSRKSNKVRGNGNGNGYGSYPCGW